jgi:alkylation response protein AidB-like acyl-CoA dehydrogenase
MDFELSEDQRLLVDTVSSFVKKESPIERMRKLRDSELGWDKSVWKKMGELGWLGVMFPESVGGAEMGFVTLGMMLEQLGTALVPEPILPLVLAGVPLWKLGNAEQQQKFLAPAIAGDESLALAYAEEKSRFDVATIDTSAKKSGSGYSLNGKKRMVLNGHAADHLVVSATSGTGVSLFVVDPGMKGVTVQKLDFMDGGKGAIVTLDDVEVGADRLLGGEGKALEVLELTMDYGVAAACSEASGILQTVLWMTRGYLMERKQFGVAIGSFQALQHRTVDMFVETELAKSVAIMAMLKVEESDVLERKRAISAAKVQIGESGAFVTRQGIQLHGGIGVTDEHNVGLFFKRMHVLGTLFGDELFHLQRYASLPSFEKNVTQR